LSRSLRTGANGYLLKRTPPAKLLEAISDVHAGNSVMSSQIARMVVRYFHQLGPAKNTEKPTAREMDIVRLLAKGYTNKEIADLCGIGFGTVRSRLSNIYERLHVHSRTEAVVKFLSVSAFLGRMSDKLASAASFSREITSYGRFPSQRKSPTIRVCVVV